LLFLQHKVLLQQFNTGDERAQKRQPIRGSDEGEQSLQSLPWNISGWAKNLPPGNHCLEPIKALFLGVLLGPLVSYVLEVWYPDRAEMLAQTSMALPHPDCQHLLKGCGIS
jgi:hypothetical protein